MSALDLLWQVLRRLYIWAPSAFLDAGDYQEKYVQPWLGWSIDLPDWAFPVALVLLLLLSVVLAYHDLRGKAGKADVIFEIRELIFSLNQYTHGRPEQPFNGAEATIKGQLRNRSGKHADIEGIKVALMERGWFWRWNVLDKRDAQMLLNRLRAPIDLYHHGVSLEAHSRSLDISEIWAYPSIPTTVTPDSNRRYRLEIFVESYGQGHPEPTHAEIDMKSAFEIAKRRSERTRKLFPESTESTPGTADSPNSPV